MAKEVLSGVRIFAKTCEEKARQQIAKLAASDAYKDCEIRVMPDVHAGKGCTVGTVIKLNGRVVPNTVGVDIGCGMLVVVLNEKEIDLKKLDKVVHDLVPSGFNVHSEVTDDMRVAGSPFIDSIKAQCFDKEYVLKSIGTLGGGNHFIEVDTDSMGNKYLVIHSGSRNLGVSVCNYYQNLTYKRFADKKFVNRKEIIEKLKSEGRASEIQQVLKSLPKEEIPDKDLCYLEGEQLDDYLHDMKLVQRYADINREFIATTILDAMELKVLDTSFGIFTTRHNYIDTDTNILRKGAICANFNQRVIIPMNMRDGSLLCIGEGNNDWLCSAPHGAGRLMSRSEAKKTLKLEDYSKEMAGIYTTSVCDETIDESPMAYKPMDEIIEQIKPTVHIARIIKPIYNFKAKE